MAKKIFDGINQGELEKLLDCMKATKRSYKSGEIIITYSGQIERTGIISSGEAQVIKYDIDGNKTILERLSGGDMFGRLFTYFSNDGDISVICTRSCEVIFIDLKDITKRCENACTYHSVFIENLLEILSDRSITQSVRIDILSQRTLRKKLLFYFELESKRQGKRSFTLPFSLSSLADYLCVDRSAMLREMKNLRDLGIIHSHSRQIQLLKMNNA